MLLRCGKQCTVRDPRCPLSIGPQSQTVQPGRRTPTAEKRRAFCDSTALPFLPKDELLRNKKSGCQRSSRLCGALPAQAAYVSRRFCLSRSTRGLPRRQINASFFASRNWRRRNSSSVTTVVGLCCGSSCSVSSTFFSSFGVFTSAPDILGLGSPRKQFARDGVPSSKHWSMGRLVGPARRHPRLAGASICPKQYTCNFATALAAGNRSVVAACGTMAHFLFTRPCGGSSAAPTAAPTCSSPETRPSSKRPPRARRPADAIEPTASRSSQSNTPRKRPPPSKRHQRELWSSTPPSLEPRDALQPSFRLQAARQARRSRAPQAGPRQVRSFGRRTARPGRRSSPS